MKQIKTKTWRTAFAALALIALALLGCQTPAQAQQTAVPRKTKTGSIITPIWNPTDNNKVAFVYNLKGNLEIFIVDIVEDGDKKVLTGKDPVNVSQSPGMDIEPVWSPDGNKLAFTSKRNGKFDICVADKSGQGDPRCLTGNIGPEETTPQTRQPETRSCKKWNEIKPDIDFGDNGEMYAECSAAGSADEVKKLWDDMHPFWSPDSSKIGYCSHRNGHPQVWIMDAGGGRSWMYLMNTGMKDDELVKHYYRSSCFASFSSKKGDKLAISADGDLYVLDLRNGKMNNLTVNLIDGVMVDDTMPVWAPRGDRIAFVGRYEAFSSELYTISSSGKKIRRITDNLYEDFFPHWQPDGRGLIFSGYVRGRNPEIFVADAESPEKTRITDNFQVEMSPSFSPDGKKIVYVRREKGRDQLYTITGVTEILANEKNDKKKPLKQILKGKENPVFPDGFNPESDKNR